MAVICAEYDVDQKLIFQWPPPEIVAILKPMREVCQGKTGVSDGNILTLYLHAVEIICVQN